MWFIFRREEKNIDNFLLWQTKTGKVVACQEKWLTAFQMALFFIWVAVPLGDIPFSEVIPDRGEFIVPHTT